MYLLHNALNAISPFHYCISGMLSLPVRYLRLDAAASRRRQPSPIAA
jgi:hypothetical protein